MDMDIEKFNLKKPFTYLELGGGIIVDGNKKHVIDIRGWGNFSILKDKKTVKNNFGKSVAEALNKYFEDKENTND
jgi:hypothetical protein